MFASNCEPVARSTLSPESAARAAAAPSSEVLPTPGSPDSSSAPPGALGDLAEEQLQPLDLRFAADQVHRRRATLTMARAEPMHLPTFRYLPEPVQPVRPSAN